MFGADTVVQIAGEHTFPDNIRFLSLHTLIVEVHRTAVEGDCTVIHHVNMLVAHFLIQLAGEYGYVLTVEIRLKSMTDSLMQQDAGTACTHYNRHFTAFGFDGLKQDSCPVHHLAGNHVYNIVCHKLKTPTIGPAGITVFHLTVFFHDTNRHERHHRTVIVVTDAFRITEQHVRRAILQIGLHLADTIIQRENLLIQFFQIRNLLFYAHIFPRRGHNIAVSGYCLLRQPYRFARLARGCNAGGSARGT